MAPINTHSHSLCPSFSVKGQQSQGRFWLAQPGSGVPTDPLQFPGSKVRWASLVAQTIKHLSAMQETQVWSLGWEDPLEKGMATHPSILALRIPWTEEPGRLQSLGSQRVGHGWATTIHKVRWLVRPTYIATCDQICEHLYKTKGDREKNMKEVTTMITII